MGVNFFEFTPEPDLQLEPAAVRPCAAASPLVNWIIGRVVPTLRRKALRDGEEPLLAFIWCLPDRSITGLNLASIAWECECHVHAGRRRVEFSAAGGDHDILPPAGHVDRRRRAAT